MKIYKKHLQGLTKTKSGMNLPLPICGKISTGIEYDTLTKEDFLKLDFEHKCKNCNNIINN
jgi:hypothetical protein